MAELTAETAPTASCCSTEAQTTCCEPADKTSCCAAEATAGDGCGCSAGEQTDASAERESNIRETGEAVGLDMTDEMLDLARANAAPAGGSNVRFIKGYIEDIPLPKASVDVVISNCVINLAADKAQVIAEAARVLRPGGRFAVSDVITDPDMSEDTREDMRQWTGRIAGALTEAEFRAALHDAGLTDIEVRPTHQVHEHASSAIVRARKPEGATS